MNLSSFRISLKKETVFFTLAQVFFWSAHCLLYGFLILYLQESGFSSFLCGVVTTGMALAGLFLPPVMGYLTNTYITVKKYLIISFALAIPCALLLPTLLVKPAVAVLAVLILATLDGVPANLLDTWVVDLSRTLPFLNFGTIRAISSVGYGFAGLAAGKLIARLGYSTIFIGHALFILLALLALLPIPEVPCRNSGDEATGEQRLSFPRAVGLLLSNRRYTVFVLSCMLYHFGMKASLTYLSVFILDAGGTSEHFGFALFLVSMFEAVFLYLASRMSQRTPMLPLYTVAVGFALLRVFSMSLGLGVNFLIGTQLLQAVAMGFYLYLFIAYISSITPHNLTATACMFGSAASAGLGSIGGNLLGGYFIDKLGLRAYALIASAFLFASLVVIIAAGRTGAQADEGRE